MSVPGTPANPNRPKSVSINESLNGEDYSQMSPERKSAEREDSMTASPLPPISAMSTSLDDPFLSDTGSLPEEKFGGASEEAGSTNWIQESRKEREKVLGESEALSMNDKTSLCSWTTSNTTRSGCLGSKARQKAICGRQKP